MRIPDIDTGNPVTFSNSNGVSWGTPSTDVITASIAAVANAAGTQTAQTGTVVFSNSNNVSFGMSNSSVITASASFAQSTAPSGIAAGTQTATSGTVIFSNSNGLSFGMSGSLTVTASADYVRSVSAGTTNATGNQIVFSNSNNVSFGANGATVTASASYSQSTAPAAIAAGTQTATSGTVVFSNSNNVTFGMQGSSLVTASVTYAPVLSLWQNMSEFMFQGSTFNSLSLVPLALPFPALLTANTFLFGVNGIGSQSTSSGSMLFSFGVYTLNNSTLSLLNSVATSLTFAAVSNNSTAFSGPRWLSIHSSQWSAQPVFSQAAYWLGYIVSSSNATQSLAMLGQAFANAQGRFGTVGVNGTQSAGSLAWLPFMGAYSATTSVLPSSINQSDLNAGATVVGNFLPHVVMNAALASF